MRKAALIVMVFAVFAAVLLPATAQALLQPGLTVNVRDGHAQMDEAEGTAEYHFTAVVRNMWSRSIFVTCNFRVYHNDGAYDGHPGTAVTQWDRFGDVGMSSRFKPGTTKVELTAKNWSWPLQTNVTQWNVWKRGCFKGPNVINNWVTP